MLFKMDDMVIRALHCLPYRRHYGCHHCTIRVLNRFELYMVETPSGNLKPNRPKLAGASRWLKLGTIYEQGSYSKGECPRNCYWDPWHSSTNSSLRSLLPATPAKIPSGDNQPHQVGHDHQNTSHSCAGYTENLCYKASGGQ